MPFNVPTLTLKQWREQTSIAVGRRTGDITRLDTDYEAFLRYLGKPQEQEHAFLFLRDLRAYLMAKSGNTGDWDQVHRNRANNGIMKLFYDGLLEGLRGDARVAAWTTAPATLGKPPHVLSSATGRDGQDALLEYDIPNARMGALYLLSKINVEVDIKGVMLDGVAKLGMAAASIGVNTASSATNSISMTHSGIEAMQIGGGVSASPIISGAGAGLLIASAVTGGTGTDQALPAASGATLGHAARARGAALMVRPASLGTPAVAPPPRPIIPVAPPLITPSRTARVGAAIGSAAVTVGHGIRDGVAYAYNALADALSVIFEKLAFQIEKRFKLNRIEGAATVAGPVKAIIAAAIETVLLQSAPFLGASLDIVTGIARTTEAVCTRIASWMDRRKIRLMEGHATEIANAIETQMNWGIGAGLKDVLKGGANLGLQLVTFGAGALVSVILNAVEWCAKAIIRYCEVLKTRDFLTLARTIWDKEKESMRRTEVHGSGAVTHLRSQDGTKGANVYSVKEVLSLPENRSTSIFFDTARFTEFFNFGCEASVVIPMLVLNSGIGGSLMTKMHMLTKGDKVIDQAEFDAGDQYFTRMKRYSRTYLNSVGWKFHSTDAYVQGILNHAINDHQEAASALGVVRSIIRA